MQSFIISIILNSIRIKIIFEKSPFKGESNNNYPIETINLIKKIL